MTVTVPLGRGRYHQSVGGTDGWVTHALRESRIINPIRGGKLIDAVVVAVIDLTNNGLCHPFRHLIMACNSAHKS